MTTSCPITLGKGAKTFSPNYRTTSSRRAATIRCSRSRRSLIRSCLNGLGRSNQFISNPLDRDGMLDFIHSRREPQPAHLSSYHSLDFTLKDKCTPSCIYDDEGKNSLY